jgi:hypothetical protein
MNESFFHNCFGINVKFSFPDCVANNRNECFMKHEEKEIKGS